MIWSCYEWCDDNMMMLLCGDVIRRLCCYEWCIIISNYVTMTHKVSQRTCFFLRVSFLGVNMWPQYEGSEVLIQIQGDTVKSVDLMMRTMTALTWYYIAQTHQAYDIVKSKSMTLIKRRNNVVWPVGSDIKSNWASPPARRRRVEN